MAERHRKPVVRGNFAKYVGKTRKFPKNMIVEENVVYEIAIYPPEYGYSFFQVRVRTLRGDIYMPYIDTLTIWEDWTPYKGEVI